MEVNLIKDLATRKKFPFFSCQFKYHLRIYKSCWALDLKLFAYELFIYCEDFPSEKMAFSIYPSHSILHRGNRMILVLFLLKLFC